MSKPLSKAQKVALCALASRAYKHLQACHAACVDGLSLEEFRRQEQLAETGIASLSEMCNKQGHFEQLKRRFCVYLGELDTALDLAQRDTADAAQARQHLYTLRQLGADWPEVCKICQDKFKTNRPEDLGATALLQLLMTVRRVLQKRAKTAKMGGTGQN